MIWAKAGIHSCAISLLTLTHAVNVRDSKYSSGAGQLPRRHATGCLGIEPCSAEAHLVRTGANGLKWAPPPRAFGRMASSWPLHRNGNPLQDNIARAGIRGTASIISASGQSLKGLRALRVLNIVEAMFIRPAKR